MKKNTYTVLIALFLFAVIASSCSTKKDNNGRQGYDEKVKEELLREGFILKNEPDGSYKVTGRLLSTGHLPKGEYQITVNPDLSLTIFDGDRFVAEVAYPSGKDSLYNLILKDAAE